MYFLEYAIGLRADAPHNRLVWRIEPGGRRGCERFRFNAHVASLIAAPAADGSKGEIIRVQSDSPFELEAYFQGVQKTFAVKAGEQEFEISGTSQR